jgi:putative FmdB family regulatory protein
MPVYEYACTCGSKFERRQSFAERGDADCPLCGRPAMVKFSPTSLIFVHEHFRHLQSQFFPPKGDPRWADIATKADLSQYHSPKEEGPTLKEHLQQEFGLTRERIVTTHG